MGINDEKTKASSFIEKLDIVMNDLNDLREDIFSKFEVLINIIIAILVLVMISVGVIIYELLMFN